MVDVERWREGSCALADSEPLAREQRVTIGFPAETAVLQPEGFVTDKDSRNGLLKDVARALTEATD